MATSADGGGSPGALRTHVEIVDSFDSVRTEWEALAARLNPSPFLRVGWVAADWRAYARSNPPRIVCVRDHVGTLLGVAPLQQTSRSAVYSVSMNSYVEWSPLVEPGSEADMAEAILLVPAARITLRFLRAGTPFLAALERTASRTGWQFRLQPYERSPYIDLAGGIEGFNAAFSSQRRRDLRRRHRRLEELGAVSFDVVTGGTELRAALDEMYAVEASGWKGRAGTGTAIACNPAKVQFYNEVAQWAEQKGWLRLSFLRLDGRVIAAEFGLEVDRTYYTLKTGFDESLSRWSPGRVHFFLLLHELAERGVTRVDMLGHAEEHKLTWTDTLDDYLLVHLFAPTVAGRAQAAAHRTKHAFQAARGRLGSRH